MLRLSRHCNRTAPRCSPTAAELLLLRVLSDWPDSSVTPPTKTHVTRTSAASAQVDDVDPDEPFVDLVQDAVSADAESEEGGAAPRERCWRPRIAGQVVHGVEDGRQPGRVVGHERLGGSERLVGPGDLVGQALALRGDDDGSPRADLASA